MIYNGYSQIELDSLLKLLDELNIPHALGADQSLMEQTTQGDKGQRRGALNASYMVLEIPDEELKKIDPTHYKALEKYHIYPQFLDMPEELHHSDEALASAAPKAPKKANKLIQVAMMVITAMMLYAALKGR